MRSSRRHNRLVACVAASLAMLAACERNAPPPRADSAQAHVDSTVAGVPIASAGTGWNPALGNALLVQGETRDEAIVLLPQDGSGAAATGDASSIGAPGTAVSLVGRGGARFTGELGPPGNDTDPECRLRPLRNVRADGAAAAWAVGFVGVQPEAIPLDSIDLLSSRDSMALAAEASRLASTVTAPTNASFQGLRFSAYDIRHFEAAPGVQALVAHLVRKVNQEANPQEEQTLLIAERDSGATSGPYQLVYAERSHGLEEAVATPEVIASVRVSGHTMLVVARDGDAGVSYVILERTGPRQWRVRWTSAPTRCS